MDYPYESLGPEKFQLFCQALLAKDHPDLQCLPIAQPDGGRDALQMFIEDPNVKGFAVFQVKFVRQHLAGRDSHKWLAHVMRDELPKIKKLIPAGAKRFVLMTNVAGTAHPQVGSIDTVNALLSSALGIPAGCWWRNDLSRHLDDAWDLKWAYPELMTGPDLIRLVFEAGLSEHKDRRTSAIQAFVTHQYGLEQEVRFKQIDLQNSLIDLFIDVPVDASGRRALHLQESRFRRGKFAARTFEAAELADVEIDADVLFAEGPQVYHHVRAKDTSAGAATVLLGLEASRVIPLVVLEGAPGQGKSTITQYICQVHRMRLLNKTSELGQIKEQHRASPVRLPIKVDLRDFAAWLIRRNPFSAEGEEVPVQMWNRSLESFLAALICNQSGGASFDVADLHAVSRLSAILLVLDGLDEVADIRSRSEVVGEIENGVERLSSVAASLQVIVTSRPAAFANSPGLSEQSFRYLHLASLTRELIEEYANKWLGVRRVQERQGREVIKILREKLDQPHMRDLARNPMQLAILLSLINNRGTSLPDKRTALYDSYVDLFFNREAEKSEIVRDNRDLLIDIHRYLAWLLHTQSEQGSDRLAGRPNGAIEESQLRVVLTDYLSSEGRDPSLVDSLLTGVVERVVALVSRVQGTYEFEVQPLREYFAARFLYETAPYSPVGNEKRGTKPDRFDAIARNFYWLNVTRFYAGCYSKGELASLIDRLKELARDAGFRLLSHPRLLAATLLSDWVFTQQPRSVSEVLNLILDGIGLRFLLASNSRRLSNTQPLVLPAACGRRELIDQCLSMLRRNPPADYALDIIDLLEANASREEIQPRWYSESLSVNGERRTEWLWYGVHLGCVSTTAATDIDKLLADEDLTLRRAQSLLNAGRGDILESSPERFNFTLTGFLDRTLTIAPERRSRGTLLTLGQAIDPWLYAMSYYWPSQTPLVINWKRHLLSGRIDLTVRSGNNPKAIDTESCDKYLSLVENLSQIESRVWATSLTPWEQLVEEIRRGFGERFAACHLANVASGIKSLSETCTDSPELFDVTKSLCRRVRYARLRAGNQTWWQTTLNQSTTPGDQMLSCIVYFTWASGNNISQTVASADEIVSSLSDDDWCVLFDSVQHAVNLVHAQSREREIELQVRDLPVRMSIRTLALLRLRTKSESADWLYRNGLGSYSGLDSRILRVLQPDAVERLARAGGESAEHLKLLERGYLSGILSQPYETHYHGRRYRVCPLPISVAIEIAEKADQYPSFLVAAAEACCLEGIAERVKPVALVAEEDLWFVER